VTCATCGEKSSRISVLNSPDHGTPLCPVCGREEIRATLKAALRDGICVCNSSRTGLARDCSRCSRLRAQAGAL
jgi:hypothetical protein